MTDQRKQILRIIKILELLSMGRKVTTLDLFEYFKQEYSLRTLQRDIITIQEAGIPVLMSKGSQRRNEYYFPSDYRKMILPVIHPHEVLSLYLFKNYLKGLHQTTLGKKLDAVIEKLEDILVGEVFLGVAGDGALPSELLWSQEIGSPDYAKYDNIINAVVEAIIKQEWVELTYQSLTDQKLRTYTVFVRKLFIYASTVYAIIYFPKTSQDLALAIHRIQEINPRPLCTLEVPAFDFDHFRSQRFAVFYGDIAEVKLYIDKEFVKWISERDWHPSQKEIRHSDGSMILEMKVPLSPDFISWILSWHRGIKVLKPEALKEIVVVKLQDALTQYKI